LIHTAATAISAEKTTSFSRFIYIQVNSETNKQIKMIKFSESLIWTTEEVIGFW